MNSNLLACKFIFNIDHNHLTLAYSEKALIEGCKANRRDVQKVLYDVYAAKFNVICHRYMPTKEEAEDVLQEGFIKIFGSIHQYTGSGSFEGWMRRIIVNTALEFLRKKKVYYHPTELLNTTEHPMTDPEAPNNIALNDLLHAIQALPAGCRIVFNLYIMEGYSHKEIAALLHISESTSKSQLSRSRQLLQEKLNRLNATQPI